MTDTLRDAAQMAFDYLAASRAQGPALEALRAALAAQPQEANAEIARLREALESVRQYGSDTLSGRADGGPNDRAWQRAAVREMTRRAEEALKKPAAEPQPVALVPLTEERIEDCIDASNRKFNCRSRGPCGQIITTYDDWKHWLAREIEAAHGFGAAAEKAKP